MRAPQAVVVAILLFWRPAALFGTSGPITLAPMIRDCGSAKQRCDGRFGSRSAHPPWRTPEDGRAYARQHVRRALDKRSVDRTALAEGDAPMPDGPSRHRLISR